MFGRRFYHESLRKVVVAFGTIFNNIIIHRTDADGSVLQRLKVPLSYSPKEKFLTRLEQQPNLANREMAVSLPRMGFEISVLLMKTQIKLEKQTKDTNTQYFNIILCLTTYVLIYILLLTSSWIQIIEQILPYFQPDYTVTINAIPEMGIKRDVPITLNSVNYEDTYDGSFTTRRAVNYTLGFTAKTYLYGPVYAAKVIKETTADIFTDTASGSTREERIVVVPNPTTSDADDDFGFTTTITNFADSKTYNQTTDSDE